MLIFPMYLILQMHDCEFVKFYYDLNLKLINDEDFLVRLMERFVIDFVKRPVELVLHLINIKNQIFSDILFFIYENHVNLPNELSAVSSITAKLLLCMVKCRMSNAKNTNPCNFGKLLCLNFK